jgi:hypothetical protein
VNRACRSIARKHIGLRGPRSEVLQTIIPLLDKPISAEALEIVLLADGYEAVTETWRDHMRWCRPITGSLTGGEHIDAALAGGHGAVLWICNNGPGRRVALRSLAEAGYSPVALRHFAHPYSPSRFCQALMNPISNRADDCYLESVVITHDDNMMEAMEAMEALGAHLATNKLVQVIADETFGQRHETPFLGGTLHLGWALRD